MKTKLLLLMLAIGMMLAIPGFSYAQGFTDEDIDWESGDLGNNDNYGPVSLDATIIKGSISHENQTLTLNFLEDMGIVTICIADANNNIYIIEEINTSKEATKVISIAGLSAQKYTIVCYNPIENQKAEFELHK